MSEVGDVSVQLDAVQDVVQDVAPQADNTLVDVVQEDAVSPQPVVVSQAVSPQPAAVSQPAPPALERAPAQLGLVSPPVPKKPAVSKPADLRLNSNQVDEILACIKNVLDGRKPSAGAMLRIVANCLQSSRRMKLKPDLAKKLISHSMETFLRDPENELDEDSVQSLMACADVAINEGVDVLDDVAKKKINVNPNTCCVIV